MPEVDKFGFVARLATEVLTADGGNMSAAITSGSLALASAGVPILSQVGSSCQAIIVGETGHKLLSDPTVNFSSLISLLTPKSKIQDIFICYYSQPPSFRN